MVFDIPAASVDQVKGGLSGQDFDTDDEVPTRPFAGGLTAKVPKPSSAGHARDADPATEVVAPSEGQGVVPAEAATGDLRSLYQRTLYQHVERYRYYPEAARAERLRGLVRVQFALRRDGHILSAWVEKSSGFILIDQAALDALRRAEPLPRIPTELPDNIEVLLSLDYLPPTNIRVGQMSASAKTLASAL